MAETKRIDFHAHILNHKLWDIGQDKNVLTGFGIREIPVEPGTRTFDEFQLCFEADAQIAEMDRRGVDVHVISSSTVMQGTQWAAPAEEAELCRTMNDCMQHDWIDRYPDRLIGSMVLPLQDVRLSLGEMERCGGEYGIKVVNAPARVGDDYLSAPKFDEYWSKAEELGLVTFIHPHGSTDPWLQQYSLWNSIGQPIEEVKIISSLIYEGVLDRHPEAPIVVSHGGGYMPLYMGRLDRNAVHKPWTTANINGVPSDYIRRFKYDLCVYDAETLQRLYDFLGADCLMLGSDFPFGDASPYLLLDQVQGMSDADREAIVGGNASKLLGLDS